MGFILSKCMESYIMINLIMQKPLTTEQFRKINPAKLGYVLKDGTIQFASRDAVLEYAKNMVKKGFNAKDPHEVGVVWKNNRILAVAHGDFQEVKFSKKLPNGCSSMHGHLLEGPLSPIDYASMMLKNYKESIALCPSGRYSRIVRLPGENINYTSTQIKCIKTYKELKKIENLLIIDTMFKSIKLAIKNFGRRQIGIKKPNSDSQEFNKIFNEKCAPSLSRRVAETFERLGPESGVRYESNLICQ